jgi:heme exporter protein B
VALLGALGFCGVGTLFAAMATGTRAREVLLPVLLVPIALPVVIATVRATAAVVGAGREAPADNLPWLNLLAAFDAIFVALSYLVFEYVVAD